MQEVPPNKLVTELADLLDVMDALMVLHGLDKALVQAVQQERREKRGGFVKRIKLVWAE